MKKVINKITLSILIAITCLLVLGILNTENPQGKCVLAPITVIFAIFSLLVHSFSQAEHK